MNKSINKKVLGLVLAGQILSGTAITYGAPSRYIGKNIINKWDYHQTNYDKNGQVRYRPAQTTFDTENQTSPAKDPRLPSISVDPTNLGQDPIIKVDMESSLAHNWIQQINKIVKTSSKIPNNQKLEQEIDYRIKDGKIILNNQARPINGLNGLHNLKIYANNYEPMEVAIHIVKAGTMELDGNSKSLAHNDLIFRLKDFTYGIENPIYQVELDNQILEGSCVDYHYLSDLVRLENRVLSKLTPGAHTIRVKALGYQDFLLDFYLDENPKQEVDRALSHPKDSLDSDPSLLELIKSKLARPQAAIDGLSSSTKQDPAPDLDGASGATASTSQNIDLVFDFDLLSNALILEELGRSTDHSREIIRLWEDTSKLYIQKDQDEQGLLYTFSGYKNALNQAKLKGQDLSFDDYIEGGAAEQSPNRSYNYKFVLEDGLYGEVLSYGQLDAKDYQPKLIGRPSLGDELVLDLDQAQVLDSLNRIIVNNNQLSQADYQTFNSKLTIKNSRNYLNPGNNKISIYASGFRNKTIDVFLASSQVKPSLEEDAGGLKILDLDQNYLKNLEGISLNGRGLFSNSDYSIEGDIIRLNQDLFEADSSYSLSLKSYGYQDITLNYQSKGSSLPEDQDLAEEPTISRPAFKTKSSTIDLGQIQSNNHISLEEILVENFEKAKLTFSINGEEISTGLSFEKNFFNSSATIVFSVPAHSLFKQASNQLVVSYPGYDDFNLTITNKKAESQDKDQTSNKKPKDPDGPKKDKDLDDGNQERPDLAPSPFSSGSSWELGQDKIHLIPTSISNISNLDLSNFKVLYNDLEEPGLSLQAGPFNISHFIKIDRSLIDLQVGKTIRLIYPGYQDLLIEL